MNTAQINYQTANENLKAAQQARHNYMEQFDHLLDTDEGIEQYTDLDIAKSIELNETALMQAKNEAEAELIEWSKRKVAMVARLNELNDINIAYEAAKKNIRIRHKIVEAAMKLQ